MDLELNDSVETKAIGITRLTTLIVATKRVREADRLGKIGSLPSPGMKKTECLSKGCERRE